MKHFACRLPAVVVLSVLAGPQLVAQQAATAFRVQLSTDATDQPVSGRVFVMMNQRSKPEPRFGPSWIKPEPFFAKDVQGLQPAAEGATNESSIVVIDDTSDACPMSLSKVPAGEYYVQAVLHRNQDSARHGTAVGNLYSEVERVDFDAESTAAINLLLTNIVGENPFAETDRIKHVSVRSKLLSDFHDRTVKHEAAVLLPESYGSSPERRYPVVFEISGFGGTIHDLVEPYRRRFLADKSADDGKNADEKADEENEDADSEKPARVEFIRVLLDGQCEWGHHVYANSATNGARGDAMVGELIPYLDRQFRTVADARARFVSGHSSGGWSSLWLQVNYPETFGGVWSVSPDPVDFRDWQRVNLYAENPQSVYYEEDDSRRPLARDGDRIMIWYQDFGLLDDTFKRGGQLRSFEAVFSPLDGAGQPMKMWDRQTGKVLPETVEHWKQYDIRLLLEKNWPQLREQLAGRIHITMGSVDTFYLDGATRLLAESLQKLDSDADVEMVEGANHFNIVSRERREREQAEMSESYLRFFDLQGQANSQEQPNAQAK